MVQIMVLFPFKKNPSNDPLWNCLTVQSSGFVLHHLTDTLFKINANYSRYAMILNYNIVSFSAIYPQNMTPHC